MDPSKPLTFSDLIWDVMDEIFRLLDYPSQFVLTFVNRKYRNRYNSQLLTLASGFTPGMNSGYFASNGYLSLIQWSYEFLSDPIILKPERHGEPAAALNGHLHVLKWFDSLGIPMTQSTLAAAAEGGHIEIVEWLCYEKSVVMPRNAASMAACSGNLEAVKKLVEMGSPLTNYSLTNAISSRNMDIVKYVFEIYGFPPSSEDGDSMLNVACSAGNLEIFNYIYDLGFPCSEIRMFPTACRLKSPLPILKRLIDMGYFDHNIHRTALVDIALRAPIEIFEFLISLGYTFNEEITRIVAKWNTFDVLCYIITRGAPIPPDLPLILLNVRNPISWVTVNSTPVTTAQLEFLQAQGVVLDLQTFRKALEVGNFKVAFWLIEKGIAKFDREAFRICCGSGTVEIVEVALKKYGFEFDDDALISTINSFNYPVLLWASSNRHLTTFTNVNAAMEALILVNRDLVTQSVMSKALRILYDLGAQLKESDFLASITNRHNAVWTFFWNNGCRPSKEIMKTHISTYSNHRIGNSIVEWLKRRGLVEYIPPNLVEQEDEYEYDSPVFDSYHEYFYPTPDEPKRIAELPAYQIWEMRSRELPMSERLQGRRAEYPRARGR